MALPCSISSSQLLMALIAIFMIIWGSRLVEVTWHNTIADFPFLSVGVTYLPIPIGGVCLLLFIIERIFLGAPPGPACSTPGSRDRTDPEGTLMDIFSFCSRRLLVCFLIGMPDRLFAGAGGDRRRAVDAASRSKR